MEESKVFDVANRKDFFVDQLSKLAVGSSPYQMFQSLGELWNETLHSAWTNVWLKSESGTRTNWQKVGVGPVDYVESPQPTALDVRKGPAVEWVHQRQAPEFIFDQSGWEASNPAGDYTVLGKRDYKALGSEALLVLPIFSGDSNRPPLTNQLDVSGALCCHFKDSNHIRAVRDSFTDDDLMALVGLTVSHVRASVAQKHFEILVKLNQLAGSALTKITKSPRQERRAYLAGVAKLIRDAVGTKAVSIFYRLPLSDEVVCVFSDGMCDPAGKKISQEAWSNCHYKSGQNKTGKVFKTGERIILGRGESRPRDQKFLEFVDGDIVVDDITILEPIPIAGSFEAPSSGPKADGVIRCAGSSHGYTLLERPFFNDVEAQTVEFIAEQITPVLKTLSVRIQREDQVNIVRHDLLVPSTMVTDSVDELKELFPVGSDSAVGDYLLPDLAVAAKLITHLILQLDAEPGVLVNAPRKTALQSDIVSRNKFMLDHYAKVLKDIKIEFGVGPTIPPLWVDPSLVERAFFNVIVNAIKYGQPESVVTISTRSDQRAYYLDVSNTGRGIVEEYRERIFERYFRASPKKRKIEGVGLGLYIARAAIEKTGGSLYVSQLKDPTVFTLAFPSNLAFNLRRGSWPVS